MEKKENEEVVVEEKTSENTVSRETKVETPLSTEKQSLTQEQIDSIIQERLKRERESAKKEKLSSEERIKKLEETIEAEKIEKEKLLKEAEIQKKIQMDLALEEKKSSIKKYVSEKVKEDQVNNIFDLAILRSDLSKDIKIIKEEVDKIVSTIPGVGKDTSTINSELNAQVVNNVKTELNKGKEKEMVIGNKVIKDDEFKNLTHQQKQMLKEK